YGDAAHRNPHNEIRLSLRSIRNHCQWDTGTDPRTCLRVSQAGNSVRRDGVSHRQVAPQNIHVRVEHAGATGARRMQWDLRVAVKSIATDDDRRPVLRVVLLAYVAFLVHAVHTSDGRV